MCGETKVELLEASNPDSAIAKFIEKRGEGIHHIAFEVEDIYVEMERLKNKHEDIEMLDRECIKNCYFLYENYHYQWA
jgi:4-hydroxyphenylpyruvate dioxygenase-like putative hemolysin